MLPDTPQKPESSIILIEVLQSHSHVSELNVSQPMRSEVLRSVSEELRNDIL